ncbi:hypothetical protein [Pedobacter antarcticus]|uniref:hypothetical protein n=1 Tax=Pedobacter antarcticus TaxID=34086 RepID=UPI001C56C01A|nr:hypothetical protein [Pedobacter antarcticus]
MRAQGVLTKEPKFDKGIANRFGLFRKKFISTNQTEAAKELGFTQGWLSQIESAKRSVDFKLTKVLIEKYNLNTEWLTTGTGTWTSAPIKAQGGLLGKSIKELTQAIETLEGKLATLERTVLISQANETFFINRMEKFIEQQQKFIADQQK